MPGWKKIGDVARDVTKKLEEPRRVRALGRSTDARNQENLTPDFAQRKDAGCMVQG